jgi:hypothetical protein
MQVLVVAFLVDDDSVSKYPYRSLTSAIKDKASPLRQYLDATFPDVEPLQKDYRTWVGNQLRVVPLPEDGANPGTLGAAFDFEMRFRINPGYFPDIAVHAFQGNRANAIRELIGHARFTAQHGDHVKLRQACWALALCTEVYRVGLRPGSPLSGGRFSAARLLSLAPDDALRQLNQMAELAQRRLFPYLAAPCYSGPEFDGSARCPADVDVISNGVLIDFKTSVRGNSLSREDLYQLLAYTLFDRSDQYGIHMIGIYAARFGSLNCWDLQPTLEVLAGRSVSLAQERKKVWALLR